MTPHYFVWSKTSADGRCKVCGHWTTLADWAKRRELGTAPECKGDK